MMIDLKSKTVDELKVIAYDLIIQADVIKQNLMVVTDMLRSKQSSSLPAKPKPKPKPMPVSKKEK